MLCICIQPKAEFLYFFLGVLFLREGLFFIVFLCSRYIFEDKLGICILVLLSAAFSSFLSCFQHGSVDFFNVIFFSPFLSFPFFFFFFGVSLYSFNPHYYICEGHVGRGLIYAYIHRDGNSSSST